MKRCLLWLAPFLVIGSLYAQKASYRHDGGYALPDAKITPGAADPNAIADLSGKPHMVKMLVHGKETMVERNICAKDFRTGPIRASIRNFPKLKREACAEYGLAKCDKTVEGDHLESIEIGGCPDCLANIFPQPMTEARVKDHEVEDVLPKLICSGKMTMTEAQKCIATDWAACAQRIAKLK